MKNKTLTIILSIILIISITLSIYQFNTTSKLKESLSVLTNTKNELTSNIENKTTELNNITSEIEVANTTISDLTAKVESLTKEIQDTQEEIDSINSTHTDVKLGDDEYKGDNGIDALQSIYDDASEEDKAAADAALKEVMKEHPEWFTEDTKGNTNNTNQGNYEHVGTPDNGVIPEYTVGESGSEGLSQNVTVY